VALGRQPLSIRLLATAALIVMVLWPEAVVGPSFQMSLVGAGHHRAGRGAPVRAFLAARGTLVAAHCARSRAAAADGLVIELALMPVTFYHFHRAGLWLAGQSVAIPLTTFFPCR
jgi:competence protein ComEC